MDSDENLNDTLPYMEVTHTDVYLEKAYNSSNFLPITYILGYKNLDVYEKINK